MSPKALVSAMLEDAKAERLVVGTNIEKEHTSDTGEARKIALTHMKENPAYYPRTRKPKGAKEVLRYVKK